MVYAIMYSIGTLPENCRFILHEVGEIILDGRDITLEKHRQRLTDFHQHAGESVVRVGYKKLEKNGVTELFLKAAQMCQFDDNTPIYIIQDDDGSWVNLLRNQNAAMSFVNQGGFTLEERVN